MIKIMRVVLLCLFLLTIGCGQAPDAPATEASPTPTGYVPPTFLSQYCNFNSLAGYAPADSYAYTCYPDDNTETVSLVVQSDRKIKISGYTRIPSQTTLTINFITSKCEWDGTSVDGPEWDFNFYEVLMVNTWYIYKFKDKRGMQYRCTH